MGETFAINFLRDREMSRGFLTEIKETTGFSAALYKGGEYYSYLNWPMRDEKEKDETIAGTSR